MAERRLSKSHLLHVGLSTVILGIPTIEAPSRLTALVLIVGFWGALVGRDVEDRRVTGPLLTVGGGFLIILAHLLLHAVLTRGGTGFELSLLSYSSLSGLSGYAMSTIVRSGFSKRYAIPSVAVAATGGFLLAHEAAIGRIAAIPPGSLVAASLARGDQFSGRIFLRVSLPVLAGLGCSLWVITQRRVPARGAAVLCLVFVLGLAFGVGGIAASSPEPEPPGRMTKGAIVLTPQIESQLKHELNESQRLPPTPYSYQLRVGPHSHQEAILYSHENITTQRTDWDAGCLCNIRLIEAWNFSSNQSGSAPVYLYRAVVEVEDMEEFSYEASIDGPLATSQEIAVFIDQAHPHHHWLALLASVPGSIPAATTLFREERIFERLRNNLS